MRGGRATLVTVGAVAAMTFGLMSGVHALWSVNDAVTIPAMQTGGVMFSAMQTNASGSRVYSAAGEAISITLPGSEIVKVLDQTGPDHDPVFWSFIASGAALGITGVTYDVGVGAQVGPDGSEYDVSSGVAEESTILAGSTMKIYPASVSGDCSTVPETPAIGESESPRNVYVYEGHAHVLQAPGTNLAGGLREQRWCVAMAWNDDPDGLYVSEVEAIAKDEDNKDKGAIARWQAAVAFPLSLPSSGEYHARADVEALAEDRTTSRDNDAWRAELNADPSNEPNLTITLDPTITNLNPAFAPDGTLGTVTQP